MSETGTKISASLDSRYLSEREYAAIHLRVPNSGTDWLDEMIRDSLKTELAAKAMQGILAYEGLPAGPKRLCEEANEIAAMLAERGRK